MTLVTRRAGLTHEHGVRWESGGEGDYTLETVEKTDRGTQVILHLREGEDELLNGWRLRSIIRKYSDHITLPIVMKKEEWSQERMRTSLLTRTRPSIRQRAVGTGQKRNHAGTV